MPKVNHFIISLGGTGGRIMRAFRKRLFEEYRNIDPDPTRPLAALDSIHDDVFLQYLMVDSSAALFDSHHGWRVFGTSVKPLNANWLHLRQDINVPQWIRDSRSFPGIAEWIGDPKLWAEVPPGVLSGNAGGQRRRLGRLLFAANAERFRAAVVHLLGDLTRRSNQASTTFHLLCGLSGGTGSGAIVDAIAQIYKLSTHPRDRIVVYAIVPERVPKPLKNQAYYHANAYAALKELNAMLLGNYRPWDVLGGTGRIDVSADDKLKGIYLISNENADQYMVEMDDDEDAAGGLSEIVGDFMFEKLVVDALIEGGQSPIETAENVNDMPENIPNTDYALRSRRFLSFGIRRVAIPEEEITEYFALTFAKQAINHLSYNHWTETAGYIDTPIGRNYPEYVRDPSRLQRWQLTDAHLTYVAGILPQDQGRNWQPTVDGEWDDWMTQTVNGIREVQERQNWLDEIHAQFQAEFDSGYRGVGVSRFYSTRAASARAIVQTIRANVEQDLIHSWQNGAIALSDAHAIAAALRRDVEERVKSITGQISDLRDASAQAGSEAQIVRDRWARRILQRTVFKNANFERMKAACRAKFIVDTTLEAAAYLETVGPQLVQEMMGLEASILAATQHLNRALEEVQKRADARLQKSDASGSDYIVRLVDADAMKRLITNRFVLNQEIQQLQTLAVRNALIGERVLGELPTFGRIVDKWPYGELVAKIEATCEQNARQAHDNANLEENERILGVSILRKLRNDYSGRNEDFSEFIRGIVQSAHAFLRFDNGQIQMAADELGIDPQAPREPPRAVVVHLPTGEDIPDFAAQVHSQILQVTAGATPVIVPRAQKQNEITIVSTVNSFPARYLALARLLEEQYTSLLNPNNRQSERARLEMHTADECRDLPDIFAETGPPRDAPSYLLLAIALGIVVEGQNPTSGRNEVLLHYQTREGFEAAEPLARSMDQALAELRGKNALLIRAELHRHLSGLIHQDLKAQLRQKLNAQLEEVKAKVRGDLTHPLYRAQTAATERAFALVEGGLPGVSGQRAG